jgi:serine carboxypeptidase 1
MYPDCISTSEYCHSQKEMVMLRSVASALLFALVAGPASAYLPNQDWGYVEVDKEHGGNMFWWFYGRQGLQVNRTASPTVLWLQGGPGASSFFGDLAEFGPLDPYLKKREFTWADSANLLFVDNPVGTGFSYVARPGPNGEGFVTTQKEVGDALILLLNRFFAIPAMHEQFVVHRAPFWIFAESYGPKYATTLALRLHEEIKAGRLNINFRGVALGDGWLDPMGCVHAYADYMYSVSLLNHNERAEVAKVAQDVQDLVDAGDLHKAGNMVDNWVQGPFMSKFWPDIENFVFNPPPAFWDAFAADLKVGGAVRARFGSTIPANVTFGSQAGEVGNALATDFLKPEFANVDKLLQLGYKVAVYEGQFDVVVPVTCTRGWIQKLSWPGLAAFNKAPKTWIRDSDGRPALFQQEYENFQLFNVLRAGHMCPMVRFCLSPSPSLRPLVRATHCFSHTAASLSPPGPTGRIQDYARHNPWKLN